MLSATKMHLTGHLLVFIGTADISISVLSGSDDLMEAVLGPAQ